MLNTTANTSTIAIASLHSWEPPVGSPMAQGFSNTKKLESDVFVSTLAEFFHKNFADSETASNLCDLIADLINFIDNADVNAEVGDKHGHILARQLLDAGYSSDSIGNEAGYLKNCINETEEDYGKSFIKVLFDAYNTPAFNSDGIKKMFLKESNVMRYRWLKEGAPWIQEEEA